MAARPGIEVPSSWKKIPLEQLNGVILVIGASNTGKTTFSRYLRQELLQSGKKVAFLDGDPGQSESGPPTTITLELPDNGSGGTTRRWFIGSTSPRGHMLEMLVGSARLLSQAPHGGTTIYDSSGLVDPRMGGFALKMAKIQLLQPSWLFAIQFEAELEPVLAGLPRDHSLHIIRLQPAPAVAVRSQQARQQKRTENFSRYFHNAQKLRVSWRGIAVHPGVQFAIHRVVGLEDDRGFLLGLGIVMAVDRSTREVTLHTPLKSVEAIAAIHPGDLYLDPESFRDWAAG